MDCEWQGLSSQMEIICKADCYVLAINGRFLLQYGHCLMDLKSIDHLEITGDLELTAVQVYTGSLTWGTTLCASPTPSSSMPCNSLQSPVSK